MRKLILLPSLLFLLAACGGETTTTPDDHGSSSTAGTTASNPADTNATQASAPAGEEATAQPAELRDVSDEEVEAAMANTSGAQPLILSSKPQEPSYQPKRTPTYGFQVGGEISDEQLANYYVDITVEIDGEEKGVISLEMWPQFAPGTVRNFLRYCDEGFYDGLGFHRIIRDFMVQGGDPNGDGSGDGPHGNILGEFQKPGEEARKHAYGVLSMARGNSPNSASCQFFICCDESPDVWNLDGAYASFGMMTKGVEVLEAMANVPVGGPRRQSPMRRVVMSKVEVKEGTAPKGELPIERPKPDLNGEPEQVTVQHILISFEGAQRNVAKKPRTAEEADALVKDLMGRLEAGEDMNSLIREFSDDNFNPEDEQLSVYPMNNLGVRNLGRDKAEFQLQKLAQARQEDYRARIQAGTMTVEQAGAEFQSWVQEELAKLDEEFGPQTMPRSRMAESFGDVSFGLAVGEIGLAKPEIGKSPFGYHIIKRIK